MKRVVLIACAVASLAILPGCRSTGPYGGADASRPSIPDYPKLTRTFDTSARFSVYGVNGERRNGLIRELLQAGYADADARSPEAVGQIVAPDWIVDIVSVDCTSDGCWRTCHLTVRVRKPMKTAPGGVPVVDVGKTFEAWAQSMITGSGAYAVKDGICRYTRPKLDQSLFAQACANLMNVEAFRLALERK